MSTKTKNGNQDRRQQATQNRRGRDNPSRNRVEPVGNWEADVTLASHGATRPDMKRKVKTRGIKRIDTLDLMDEIRYYLRRGFEVRLTSENDGDCLRIYPCLDADYSKMFAAAMTMGSFRESLNDIGFTVKYAGEEIEPERVLDEKQKRAEKIRGKRAEVTPDMLVRCPNCGTEFRVGQKI